MKKFELKDVQIATQKKTDGVVSKAKAGRPAEPHKGVYHIKMPKSLHAQMRARAQKTGQNISAFICQCVTKELESAPIN